MCLGGKIKREKVNFAKLYEGIKNDVVRERISCLPQYGNCVRAC